MINFNLKKNHWVCFLAFFFFCFLSGKGLAVSDKEIGGIQKTLQARPVGERIAFWAAKFLGTPYDQDPQGFYVTQEAIVADEKVDCMYLTFRAVELALSDTPEGALRIALEKRFHTQGQMVDGKVKNYEDRFEYGEDMIVSGKWGKEVTRSLGPTLPIEGTRGRDFWEILPKQEFLQAIPKLKSGDLIYFIKAPKKRTVGESVGHIGIVKTEAKAGEESFYLIHASGTKIKGGRVKKVLLKEYISTMSFIGVQVTRFP